MSGTRCGVVPPEQAAKLSGLEFLRAMMRGELPAPPIAEVLRFRLVEADEGRAVFEGEPGPHLLNPLGGVHGGWALTLIDTAAGCALHTMLPNGALYTTVETKANMTRPIRHDAGPVRAEGKVITRGRQIATAEARILDAEGRVLAHGGSTLLIKG